MRRLSKYFDFLRNKGMSLSEINPGSAELALTVNDALQALELLIDSQVAILGGDILSEKDGKLVYAYQLWGAEYHYLNWYCERDNNEDMASYLKRSYDIARKGMADAFKIAEQLKNKCYIVFVI